MEMVCMMNIIVTKEQERCNMIHIYLFVKSCFFIMQQFILNPVVQKNFYIWSVLKTTLF